MRSARSWWAARTGSGWSMKWAANPASAAAGADRCLIGPGHLEGRDECLGERIRVEVRLGEDNPFELAAAEEGQRAGVDGSLLDPGAPGHVDAECRRQRVVASGQGQ